MCIAHILLRYKDTYLFWKHNTFPLIHLTKKPNNMNMTCNSPAESAPFFKKMSRMTATNEKIPIFASQENIPMQKMIAMTTYHPTYDGTRRRMAMDMMCMRNRLRRV